MMPNGDRLDFVTDGDSQLKVKKKPAHLQLVS